MSIGGNVWVSWEVTISGVGRRGNGHALCSLNVLGNIDRKSIQQRLGGTTLVRSVARELGQILAIIV